MLIVAVVGATFLGAVITLRVALRNPSILEDRPAASAATAVAPTPAPVARRETRPTLDPASFSGKAALAYQVAREIPEVLDQLHCYCACGSQYGHVSLLSCYVDGHGST
jgi:hypothetical protein